MARSTQEATGQFASLLPSMTMAGVSLFPESVCAGRQLLRSDSLHQSLHDAMRFLHLGNLHLAARRLDRIALGHRPPAASTRGMPQAPGKLLTEGSSLGMDQDLEARAELLTKEAITTVAVEGETLARESVRSSVARQLGLSTTGLSTDRSADGRVSVLIDITADAASHLTAGACTAGTPRSFPLAIRDSPGSSSTAGGVRIR